MTTLLASTTLRGGGRLSAHLGPDQVMPTFLPRLRAGTEVMVSARFVQFMWTERRVVVEHGSVTFDGELRTANQNANAVSTDPACPVWDLHQVNRRHHLWYPFGHQQGGLLVMEDAPAG